MPEPIHTSQTTGIYGAPRGLEAEVGGLPYYRAESLPGVTAVYSVWQFSDAEREWIAKGKANLIIGIVGMEPIPPISIQLRDDDGVQPIDTRPPKPPAPPKDREYG